MRETRAETAIRRAGVRPFRSSAKWGWQAPELHKCKALLNAKWILKAACRHQMPTQLKWWKGDVRDGSNCPSLVQSGDGGIKGIGLANSDVRVRQVLAHLHDVPRGQGQHFIEGRGSSALGAADAEAGKGHLRAVP